MNWDAIGAVGEVIGAFAVVVTLFYLARQISQSTASSNAAAIQTFFNTMESLTSDLMRDANIREMFSKALYEWETLSREDKQLVHLYWGNCATKLHMGFRLYKQGILDAESYETWEDFLLSALQTTGVNGWWQITYQIYAPDFVERINNRLLSPDTMPAPITETIPYFNRE